MSKTVSTVLLEVLAEAGVHHIYGIPGDAINGLIDAIRQQDVIRFVHVRHEETGAFAASAHAKLTGELGVCVGTAGPGAIHLLNGLYDAKLDHAPVLAITGQVETEKLGSHYHQEVDLYTLFKDVAAFNQMVVNPAQVPSIVVEAVQTALAERTVAHLTLPLDIATARVPDSDHRPRFDISAETAPCEADLDSAASVLNEAERVTMLAGAGTRAASAEVLDVAETLGAPIVKTLRAKDIIPDDHPLCVGGLGLLGTVPAVAAVEGADVLLMVGTDFPYEDFYPTQARAVQIDLNAAHLGRRFPIDVGLVGHSHLALQLLHPRLQPKEDRTHLEAAQQRMGEWQAKMAAAESSEDVPIRPQRVAATIGRIADDDAVFVCDTGAVTVWAARNMAIRKGQRFTLSSSLASMAFSLPGAIGAQLAFPDREVIALAGDGGFTMLMSDFLTAVDLELPITVVVFNNHKLGLIQMEQESQGLPEFQTALRNPDFAEFGRLCGGEGAVVTDPDELEPVLDRAFSSSRPWIIDVHVSPNEIVVPPKILGRFVLGYAVSKVKEMMGKGDREGGLDPLGDLTPLIEDRQKD
jgi:pyruvate oxidase